MPPRNPNPPPIPPQNPNPPPIPPQNPPPNPPTPTDCASSQTTSIDNPLYTPVKPLTHAHHYISIKLTPKNYLLWHNQLSFFLKGQGLYGYLDGSIPCPLSPYSPDRPFWEQQDAAIVSTLISSLSESVMPDAIGKPTSKSLWDCLRDTYAKASTARTMYLRSELRDLKQNDLSISEYFNKAQFLRDELTAINKAPTADDFLCQVLMHLRPEFSEMKSSVLARPDEPSFEEVKNLFLAAESMSAAAAPPTPLPTSNPHSALLSQGTTPGSRPSFLSRCGGSYRGRFNRGRSNYQSQSRFQPRGN